MGAGDREALEAFLARPATYGLGAGETVARIDTHISAIFLAGDRAYKLKKPVDFGYLDFTSCEKRRIACVHELELNSRTAPALYLDVIAVKQTGTGFALGGEEGETVDWLLEMVRFGQENVLSARAADGTLERATVEELARVVAGFHATAEIRRDAGGAARFADILTSNEENYAPFVGPLYDAPLIEALNGESRKALSHVAALLDTRREAGWVRHCHGDLHLGNVTLIDGAPVLFDCIEFNDDFARIDVLYDLAFLLMDLAFRAQVDRHLGTYANAALNAYLQAVSAEDLEAAVEGLGALPFFMGARAGVRSHVNARGWDGLADGAGRRAAADQARAYARFALDLLQPAAPCLYAVGGLSGTGKTTVARALAPHLPGPVGAVHLRTDILRKQLAGVAMTDRLPASAYTAEASAAVYGKMLRLARTALKAGRPVICDAVFAAEAERRAVETLAADEGVSFLGLWLAADPNVLESRVEDRAREGRDASDATADVVRIQLGYELGEIGWTQVDAAGAPDSVLARAMDAAGLTAG